MEVKGLVTVLSTFVLSLSSQLSEVLGGPSDHTRLSETIERGGAQDSKSAILLGFKPTSKDT